MYEIQGLFLLIITFIVYSLMFMISFEFHTQNGNLQLTSYSLQEMSTLFREMSTNQFGMVHGFSHVCSPLALIEVSGNSEASRGI